MPTETFDTVGSHTYSIPSEAVALIVELWGAQGGRNGGEGAYFRAVLDPADVSGDTLTAEVGEQGGTPSGGYNGGGPGGTETNVDGGGGGGASDVRDGPNLEDRLLVAAGGGGDPDSSPADDGTTVTEGSGGDGGPDTGEDGGTSYGGSGGTQSSGGSAGHSDATDGSLGSGGSGSSFNGTDGSEAAGGGGGGGYNGGGGGGTEYSDKDAGGGGGGSNFAVSEATVEANQRGGNTDDGQVVITSVEPLGAPQNATIDAERETELDLSWDAVQNADEYQVYRHDAADPYNNGSQVATIPDDGSSSYSYTDTGLTNGRKYHYQIVADNTTDDDWAASDPSAEAQGVTLLPSPTIDGTDPFDDRVGLTYSLPDDNPDGHVAVFRSTDGSLGTLTDTIPDLSLSSHTDTTVTTGETYHYTLRRDTGDATADSTQVEETATFRPIVELSATAASDTEIDLAWSADSTWTGSIEVWRDRSGYDYGDPKGTQVDTIDASERSYTDSGLDPNTEYTYTLVAIADDEPTKESDPASTTTDGLDVPKTRSRSAEWTVEIRLENQTLRPPIVDEPQLQPRANDLPKIRLPTTEGPWTRLDLEDGAEEMAIWYRGVRQPIEELERVEEADDNHVLVGRGGVELLDRVQVEVGQQPVYELAQDLIQDHTSYAAVVDAPPEDLSEETIYDIVSASAWENLFSNTDFSTIPVDVDPDTGELYNQQSLWLWEGEDWDSHDGSSFVNGEEYCGNGVDDGFGGAERFNAAGQSATYPSIEIGYTIPAEHVQTEVRLMAADENVPAVTMNVYDASDDSLEGHIDFHPDSYSTGDDVLWSSGGTGSTADYWTGGDLGPGEYYVELESSGENTGNCDIDVFTLHDDRYSYTFDNSVTTAPDGSNYLDGPEKYPEVEVQTDFEALVLSAVGADVTTVWDDTSGAQRMQVTNDGGNTWYPQDGSGSNTETVSHDWADPGASIGVRLRFGRHGSRETTPAQGFEGQRVDSLELTATLDDTPLVVDQSWDTSLRDVLRDLAEQAGDLWDVQWAGTGYGQAPYGSGPCGGSDGMEVHWTTPGVREATVDAAVTTYDTATDVREQAARVVVVGGNGRRAGELVTADHGAAIDLDRANLIPGRESVFDADSGREYQSGSDYEMDYNDGQITTLAEGDISDGQALTVDYDYETRGEFESEEATTDRTITRNITNLTSDRQCAIAARRISLELRDPLHEAEVGVQPGPRSWSIVNQITVGALPFEGPYTVRETRTQDGEQVLRMGSRQSVEEIVSEINDNVSQVSRRV